MGTRKKGFTAVQVPADMVERVQRYVRKATTQVALGPIMDRLAAVMGQPFTVKRWVHAEVSYRELVKAGVDVPEFLDRLAMNANTNGWALAAMGPRSIVLRNMRGGRSY